jgi:hypothetical protein
MRNRWANLIILLAAATALQPARASDPVFEHFKGTWKVTLMTRHGTTCSADQVTFSDAADDKPIKAEFALSCGDKEGVSGFVQITVDNPGQQDAMAHVDAQAARNHPGRLYNATGRISWPSPDHLVMKAQPSRQGTMQQFDFTRTS